jgi:hypothetical protein
MTRLSTPSRFGLVAGLSVSDPAEEELVRLGLSRLHIQHVFIEITRHILARGWSVSYGGDLRTGGYTEALFDLVRTYNPRDLPGPDRVTNYLAWPNWLGLSASASAATANIASTVRSPTPEGAPQDLPARQDRTPEHLAWAALGLTSMREQMTSDVDVRIILGGRGSGQQGLYPGLVEEAVVAIRSGVPLFVMGGFGGAGGLVARALTGATVEELGLEYQIERGDRYADLLRGLRAMGHLPDFPGINEELRRTGHRGLANGLDEPESVRLAESDDVDEVIALVLRGCSAIAARDGREANDASDGRSTDK